MMTLAELVGRRVGVRAILGGCEVYCEGTLRAGTKGIYTTYGRGVSTFKEHNVKSIHVYQPALNGVTHYITLCADSGRGKCGPLC